MKCFLLVWVWVLTSCSNVVVVRAHGDGYPGTPQNFNQAVKFSIPDDWSVSKKFKGGLELETKVVEAGKWGPIIKISFGRLDPTVGGTVNEQVSSYLNTIRIKEDSTVRLEKSGDITNADSETIPVWYFHSPQYGYRLHAEKISEEASFKVRLICDSTEELEMYSPDFRALVKSSKMGR